MSKEDKSMLEINKDKIKEIIDDYERLIKKYTDRELEELTSILAIIVNTKRPQSESWKRLKKIINEIPDNKIFERLKKVIKNE